jgi:predicted transcriptional regulator
VKSDDIGEVIRKMVKSNMKHLPLLDDEKRVICDISMIDIIKRMIETEKE